MGIRDLKKFVEEKLGLLQPFELCNCNVLFDGNSIYHQMYRECHLTCLFGGEYEKFAQYCRELFQSFQRCQINVIVVFDGARIDDRKFATVLQRSKKRIDYSTQMSVNVDLSPLLLRSTFIDVLNQLNIPYVSALGEADEECVSLANHLDCYLIGNDSDYFCFDLHRGYIPFDYVDINPVEKESHCYLSSQFFHLDSLLERFSGLNSSTLALACCLCGNDYIERNLTAPIFEHITYTVEKTEKQKGKKDLRTIHWYAMKWIRHFPTVDRAMKQIADVIQKRQDKNHIEKKLQVAMQSYINPADTLIYRFVLPNNDNLRKSPHFIRLAQEYLEIFHRTDEQSREEILLELSKIKSKCQHLIPTFLCDGLTDLYAMESFIEILIHRRLICAAHVEIEREPSIYTDAIPIILPCLAMLIKWDEEPGEPTVTIYHRVFKQLKPCVYTLIDYDDLITFEQFNRLSFDERREWVLKSFKIPPIEHRFHSDYSFWFVIISYWYSVRQLSPVYLYGLIVSFIQSTYLKDTKNEGNGQMIEPFSLSITDERNSTLIDLETRQNIGTKLKAMTKKVYQAKKFDCSIIHEFNCLQTIYFYAMKLNDFFARPFAHRDAPQHFLRGSFFYAFVEHYENKQNLFQATCDLLQHNSTLVNILKSFLKTIVADENLKDLN